MMLRFQALTQPFITISIASGGTPNWRARPAFASPMVRPPGFDRSGGAGGARTLVGAGIGGRMGRSYGDIPGVRYKVIRGALDTSGVRERSQARSPEEVIGIASAVSE